MGLSNPKSKKRRKKNPVLLEPLFQGVREALIHDLAPQQIRGALHSRLRGGIVPLNDGATPYLFKKWVQCTNFGKRVIWSDDRSFEELSEEALAGFKDSQQNFLVPEPMNRRAMLVIQKAQEICSDILEPFSYDTWFDSCSFGKRAAKGLPRRESYLDTRFERASGSQLQWAAFHQMLSRDPHLLRAFRERCSAKEIVDTISATAVPKSFKAARIIAPDTILGGLLSRGLGDYVRTCLERNTHINLSKQQDRHKRWAQRASRTGFLATIDMSKASDSFTWRHIELLVPSDWHHALEVCHIGNVDVSQQPDVQDVISIRSYMLMGSGHTFPLQTLLFYCLAEATRILLKQEGSVSVYGDDIIVPVGMSSRLMVIMKDLGFVINSEKSFYDLKDHDRPSQTFFRESCGGDYKGGIDVRPYMPECDLQENKYVPCNNYLAWCHKMINGLLDRWEPCEIPWTLGYLLRCITNQKKAICFVPSWEVDHAGIKHYIPDGFLLGSDVERIRYHASIPMYRKLVFEQKRRPRGIKERPYYWYKLQTSRNALKRDPRYDTPVSLTGEARKTDKGCYRWRMFSPKGDPSNPIVHKSDMISFSQKHPFDQMLYRRYILCLPLYKRYLDSVNSADHAANLGATIT